MEKKIYKPRLTEPSKTNKYYLGKPKGYNDYPLMNGYDTLKNCTAYAAGRFAEMAGASKQLVLGKKAKPRSAYLWFKGDDGRKRSQTPVIGAVACWQKIVNGKVASGHVAIVERIYKDKNGKNRIVVSESGFNTYRFRTTDYSEAMKKGDYWKFQGYILPDYEYVEETKEGPVKGDKVIIKGRGNARKDGKGKTSYGIGYKRYIMEVYPDAKFKYKLGVNGVVTGFYNESAFKLL